MLMRAWPSEDMLREVLGWSRLVVSPFVHDQDHVLTLEAQQTFALQASAAQLEAAILGAVPQTAAVAEVECCLPLVA